MSKFIELTTTGGGKTIINLDAIESIVDCGSLGTSIHFKERSEDIAESYEQVRALIATVLATDMLEKIKEWEG